MILHKNGIETDAYDTSYAGKNICVSIDSSKSNSAMFVWDEYGYVLDDYEISGAGKDVDVYDLCWQTREQLKVLFKDAKIIKVYIEDIITKNEKDAEGKSYKGMSIHQSRAKITAVFNNFIFFFQDYHHVMPRLVNNWEWKSHILPKEFRKKDHDKGSLDWCKAQGNRYAERKDDVTDAWCIGLYMFMAEKIDATYIVDTVEPARGHYNYGIFPENFPIPEGSKKFEIQNKDSLIHNIETISNRIEKGQPGVVKLPVDALTFEDVYSGKVMFNNQYTFIRGTQNVLIIVYSGS